MLPEQEGREFDADALEAAEDFLRSLPEEVTRVYVDEWSGREWRFVFGDDRGHALKGLGRLRPGVRFRIRTG